MEFKPTPQEDLATRATLRNHQSVEGVLAGARFPGPSADLAGLPDGMGSLSVITNEDGGVIDDCIVTNAGDHLYMVINAGHEDKDLPHMQKYLDEFKAAGGDAAFETLADNGILALQGPKAAEVLQRYTSDDLSKMAFMSAKPMTVNGQDIFVARS